MKAIVATSGKDLVSVLCHTALLNRISGGPSFVPIPAEDLPDTRRLKEIFDFEEIDAATLEARYGRYLPAERPAGTADPSQTEILHIAGLLRSLQPLRDSTLVICLGVELATACLIASLVKRCEFALADSFGAIETLIRDRRPEHSLLFLPHDSLTAKNLERLTRWQSTLDTGIGIVTGAHRADVYHLIVKMALYGTPEPGAHLLISDLPFEEAEAPAQLINEDELSLEHLELLRTGLSNTLCMSSHGDNVDADLGPGVLCGRVRSHAHAGEPEEGWQACMVGDYCRRNIRGTKQLLPIDAVRTRFIFNESCSGIAINESIFPRQLSLAAGALSGWCLGYLSSIKITKNTPAGLLLVHTLLLNGYSLGAAARLFTAYHQAETGDQPSFLLLGDPSLRLAPQKHIPEFAVELDDAPDDFFLDLDLSGSGQTCFFIRLNGSGAEALAGNPHLQLMVEREDEALHDLSLVYLRHFDNAPLTAILLSPFAIHACKVRIRITARAAADNLALQAVGTDASLALAFLGYVQRKAALLDGLRDTPELRKLVTDLTAAIHEGNEALLLVRAGLPSVAGASAGSADKAKTQAVRYEVRQLLDRGSRLLANAWPSWKMSHYFVPFYKGYLVKSGVEKTTGRHCGYCGNAIYETTMTDPLRNEVGRLVSLCARCGIVSDRPSSEDLAFIEGPSVWKQGAPLLQQIRIRNTTANDATYAIGISLEGDYPWFSWSVDEEAPRVHVRAGGEATAPIRVHPGNGSLPGLYYLVCNIISNLKMHLVIKPIQLNP